jgi:hypothetical protein
MPIDVTTPVEVTKYLKMADETGQTWVKIKPVDYAAEIERDEALKNRKITADGTQLQINLSSLWALEIWLTYVETNLVVNYRDQEGNITKTISFEPRSEMNRMEFMRRLAELPPGIVYEWHSCVVEVVPDWAVPF